jgi:acyl dehydratase
MVSHRIEGSRRSRIAGGKMTKFYLEDFTPGRIFTSDNAITLDAMAIKSYASQFDPQPFHLDEKAAENTFFKGLAASGWHTMSVTMRLMVDGALPIAGGIVGAGADEIRWPRATRPGDSLRVQAEVLEARPSKSRPDQGLIKVLITTLNQNDEPVQTMIGNLVVPKRTSA